MKKILTVMILTLVMMFVNGCINEQKTEKTTQSVNIVKSGMNSVVVSNEQIIGIEVEIDKSIAAEDISGNNGNLVIAKDVGGKTMVAVVVNGSAKGGLFTINDSAKYGELTINVKDKVISVNEASSAKTVKRAGEKLLGDFNGDNTINVSDFNLFATNYSGTYSTTYDIAPAQKSSGDWANIYSFVQVDGKVNILDFVIFGENYGKSNPVLTVNSVVITKPTSFTGTIEKGSSATVSAAVTYSNGTTSADAEWTSSNTAVATVANGVITAAGAGTAVITASKGGKSDTVTVTVTVPSTAITIYIEKPDAWADIWIWYNANAKATWDTTTLKTAPGNLTNYRTGWYKKVLADTDTSVEFLFNDGTWSNKLCAEGFNKATTAANYKTTKSIWITKDGKTYDSDPVGPKAPAITLSPASFTKPAGTYTVDVTVAANEGTMETVKYTLDGTAPASSASAKTLGNTGGQVSITLTSGSSVTLKVYAKNNIGESTADGVYTEGVVKPASFAWNNAAIYFVIQDRFYNGNITNDLSYGRVKVDATGKDIGTFHGGDLAGLTKKINEGYFTELGTSVIWITAPYEQIHGWVGGGSGDFAHYAYHGYYTLDYTAMDKNMGTISELREFVDMAHAKGIRVIFDIVMNHSGYNSLKDMVEYNFGKLNGITDSWTPGAGENWHSHHKSIDYTDGATWANWWGGWVRAGITGYTQPGGDDLTKCLDNLPDFKTEVTANLGLPKILQTKWGKEATGFDEWINPASKNHRADMEMAPRDYQIQWLADWVREFGIDGFRVDTAKHVEQSVWKLLKAKCTIALADWKAANPTKKLDDLPFWMTGEAWGHGPDRSSYYDNGFDSMINFSYAGAAAGAISNYSSIEGTYAGYATSSASPLSYISSHDTSLFFNGDLTRQKKAGTLFLLTPKPIQIFYGDENGRPFGTTGSDGNQGTRSDYIWGDKADILTHWQKVGKFRNRHIAVGAGTHTKISDSPYTFARVKDDDKVICVLGASGSTTVTVPANIFAEGTAVKDAYSGNTGVVSGGKVTLTAAGDVLLIEKQ